MCVRQKNFWAKEKEKGFFLAVSEETSLWVEGDVGLYFSN